MSERETADAVTLPALYICSGCRQVVGTNHTPVECGTWQLAQQTQARRAPQTTWPVVECDQNTAPVLFDIVTPEVAATMPTGTEVIVTFTDRGRMGVALQWGRACLGVVTDHKPTCDGEDVTVFVRLVE